MSWRSDLENRAEGSSLHTVTAVVRLASADDTVLDAVLEDFADRFGYEDLVVRWDSDTVAAVDVTLFVADADDAFVHAVRAVAETLTPAARAHGADVARVRTAYA